MTRADFLQTIIAAPDDDAPRLVFADWLEENGEPERAEFIRVQIELARMPEFDFKGFSYREREVVKLRCGIGGAFYTTDECARIFKITRERVRSIEASAKRKEGFSAIKRHANLRRREREIAELHAKRWISEMLGVK